MRPRASQVARIRLVDTEEDVETVHEAVVHRMTATVNPYQIGVGNHGGRDILIVNEEGYE